MPIPDSMIERRLSIHRPDLSGMRQGAAPLGQRVFDASYDALRTHR
jgi:hypothetical protein